LSDWCDTGECHNYEKVDATNGRIYKITYGKVIPFHGDISRLSDDELVHLQLHKNDWFGRHARRVLQERAVAGRLHEGTPAALLKMLMENPDVTRRLRALWTLHLIGGLNAKRILEFLDSSDLPVFGLVVQLVL